MAGDTGVVNLIGHHRAINSGPAAAANVSGVTRNTIWVSSNLTRMITGMIADDTAARAADFMTVGAIIVGSVIGLAVVVNRAGAVYRSMAYGTGAAIDAKGGITVNAVRSSPGLARAAGSSRVADGATVNHRIMDILDDSGAAMTLVTIAVPGKGAGTMAAVAAGADQSRLAQMAKAAFDLLEGTIGNPQQSAIQKPGTSGAAGIAIAQEISQDGAGRFRRHYIGIQRRRGIIEMTDGTSGMSGIGTVYLSRVAAHTAINTRVDDIGGVGDDGGKTCGRIVANITISPGIMGLRGAVFLPDHGRVAMTNLAESLRRRAG